MSDSRRKRKSSSVDSDISQEVKVALNFNQLNKISLILKIFLQRRKEKEKDRKDHKKVFIDIFFVCINFAKLPRN